jgi:hypothetical protein
MGVDSHCARVVLMCRRHCCAADESGRMVIGCRGRELPRLALPLVINAGVRSHNGMMDHERMHDDIEKRGFLE